MPSRLPLTGTDASSAGTSGQFYPPSAIHGREAACGRPAVVCLRPDVLLQPAHASSPTGSGHPCWQKKALVREKRAIVTSDRAAGRGASVVFSASRPSFGTVHRSACIGLAAQLLTDSRPRPFRKILADERMSVAVASGGSACKTLSLDLSQYETDVPAKTSQASISSQGGIFSGQILRDGSS
ncbi:hypothetical protein NA57DRAFT_53363 [Rhizodiscina lignyota]|uniref:Uncharacterized protein n=1 Tax=Rhizodiscina lignyota TaxID=1504668 RepID=A0A9P4ILC5_9PEZI|nr:hypothetical protein NA57DRAFT_53363 [Rhizodiscina lignyota]